MKTYNEVKLAQELIRFPTVKTEDKGIMKFLSRKLSGYMSKKGQAEMAKKRANLYSKYLPLVAQFCTELSGNKKEPNYKEMIKEETALTNSEGTLEEVKKNG